jgi:transcription initiation factor TFIIE subunit alpha
MAKKKIVNFLIAQDFLKKIGGPYAVDIVKIIEKKDCPITDEVIGAELKKLKITEIRTVLNQLHFRGIATYQKTRNQQTGWYTYTWEIKPARIAELIAVAHKDEILQLEQKLEMRGDYDFFGCMDGCTQLPFELAAEYQFKCPDCGKTMELTSNKKVVKDIKSRLDLIKTEISELQKMK